MVLNIKEIVSWREAIFFAWRKAMFFASNSKPLLGPKQFSLLLTSDQLVTEVVCHFCGVFVG